MHKILVALLTCCLILVAGISNAETIPVIAPYSIDNVSITVQIKAWTGSCNGSQYGATSSSVTSGANINITGPLQATGTTVYYVNATNGTQVGACASASYTYTPSTIPGAPSIGTITRP